MGYLKVTQDTMINAIMAADRGTKDLLIAEGMDCFLCPSAIGESIKEACFVHGLETEGLVQKLNEYFHEKYNI